MNIFKKSNIEFFHMEDVQLVSVFYRVYVRVETF